MKMSELAPQLCALSTEIGFASPEECEVSLTNEDGSLSLEELGGQGPKGRAISRMKNVLSSVKSKIGSVGK